MQRQRIVTKTKRVLRLSGRKRITRDHVKLELILNDKGESEAFKGSLNLSELELPQDAYVVIEAMHGDDVERFKIVIEPFPTFPIMQKELEELRGYGAALQFRVLVVDSNTRRILASAERLRPYSLKQKALLKHVGRNIGKLAWKIEFSDEGPLFIYNEKLPWGAFKSREFVCFALPAVLRQILDRALREKAEEGWEEEPESLDVESEDWKTQWLRFAQELTGLNPPKGYPDDSCEDWMNEVIQVFCTKKTGREWDELLEEYRK